MQKEKELKHFLTPKINISTIKEKGEKKIVSIITPSYYADCSDLMMKGGEFYAVLDRSTNMWITDEVKLFRMIDDELYSYRDEIGKVDGFGIYRDSNGLEIKVNSVCDFTNRELIYLRTYLKNLPKNFNYKQLDDVVTYIDEKVTWSEYRSKRLKYDILKGDTKAYDEIMTTLYDEEEKTKIEWAIGSVLAKEKLVAIYGKPGSGKSTVIDLILKIFEGYTTVFVASDLASKSNQFATEYFRNNPLVAIQDDGSLERIDSPIINEIVSHKTIAINEKGVKKYSLTPKCVLFMATNDLIDIHDIGKGISRRLLDVYPSGRKLPVDKYFSLVSQLDYEIGAIAYKCLHTYRDMGLSYYLKYKPMSMIEKTNYIHQFMFDEYDKISSYQYLTRNDLYKWYKEYCEESHYLYYDKRDRFFEQIKEYFNESYDIKKIEGKTYRHVLGGFKTEMFVSDYKKETNKDDGWIDMNSSSSLFDELYLECKAQYAIEKNGRYIPKTSWDKCDTILNDIDTTKDHYVKPPEQLIVLDFDITDENGDKDIEANIKAANQYPPTYAEYSRSGKGIHLHYIYNGDIDKLKAIIGRNIECKTFTGKSALRRKLTKCNDIPISTISSGLPLKEGGKMTNSYEIQDVRHLRNLIRKALKKETNLGGTKPNIDYIQMLLQECEKQGMEYDISDLAEDIQTFAMKSTHNARYCMNIVSKMNFKSNIETQKKVISDSEKPIVFFDCEVFKNLFIICWKKYHSDEVVAMINPRPIDVENLVVSSRLIGYNNRLYDNHILYARIMGYTEYQLYLLSCTNISSTKNEGRFGEAYNLSYTDVYDFLSSGNKKSLKKWEIELKCPHVENEWPWDQEVPKELWPTIADYCKNDVISTEKVFDACKDDWQARKMLAALSGLTVNDTTNKHTTKIIVGNDKNPQFNYVYTDLSTIFPGYKYDPKGIDKSEYIENTKIVAGKSIYRGEDPGEGGYAIGFPGIYKDVALLDVASMHPHSAIRLNIFGDEYTKRFEELVEARVFIKHGDYENAGKLLNGMLKPFLNENTKPEVLANALKTAINSVYGLTSASFDNKLKDPRNVDNIVAKYGALFMINLKHEVMQRGYKVVHIKTDSIKIANADNEIIEFVNEYGKKYGYTFEHEATYDRIALVNDAVYIAHYADTDWCEDLYGYIPDKNKKKSGTWTATGTEFKIMICSN